VLDVRWEDEDDLQAAPRTPRRPVQDSNKVLSLPESKQPCARFVRAARAAGMVESGRGPARSPKFAWRLS